MRVLIGSPGQDTGGMGIRIKRAFDKFSDRYVVRALRSSENFIQYPADIETYKTPRSAIQKIYDESDVIHCSNSFDSMVRYGHGQWKPCLITYQGTGFRSNPEPQIKYARRKQAIQTVSTIDLLTLFDDPDEGRWLPHPIDIEAMQTIRAQAEHRDKFVVYHSPTNRRVKSTDAFMAAMRRLMEEDPRVEMRLVEGATWRDNLRWKSEADLVYDQLILGWGTNALEAWAMGIPVIVATEFQRVRERMVEIVGELPGYEATVDTLYEAIRTLVNEPAVREEYAQRGLRYVQRFHDEAVAVERLSRIYDEALGRNEAVA